MVSVTTRPSERRWNLGPAVMALVIGALACGLPAASARADDRDWGHERHMDRHRDHRDRDDRGHGPYVLQPYGPPAYVYAPPPVYYAPPPGPPVIDFIFPLRFR